MNEPLLRDSSFFVGFFHLCGESGIHFLDNILHMAVEFVAERAVGCFEIVSG